ncbi:MAG: hypothetical protein CTY15_12030 [Methylocystis sp.]|nr:MAG: hypothetical protein CTY15_12030 [Methylocystis sp.]
MLGGFLFRSNRFCKAFAFSTALVVLIAFAPAAKADFLDDLFGGGPTEAPRAAPRAPERVRRAPKPSFSIRLNEGKHEARGHVRPMEKKSVAFLPESKLPKPVFCYAGAAHAASPDSADTRLHDGTLRSGDSVVTEVGILVFKGRVACPHNANDFIAVAASPLSKSRREALMALERTLHTTRIERDASAEREPQPKVVGQANQ